MCSLPFKSPAFLLAVRSAGAFLPDCLQNSHENVLVITFRPEGRSFLICRSSRRLLPDSKPPRFQRREGRRNTRRTLQASIRGDPPPMFLFFARGTRRSFFDSFFFANPSRIVFTLRFLITRLAFRSAFSSCPAVVLLRKLRAAAA